MFKWNLDSFNLVKIFSELSLAWPFARNLHFASLAHLRRTSSTLLDLALQIISSGHFHSVARTGCPHSNR